MASSENLFIIYPAITDALIMIFFKCPVYVAVVFESFSSAHFIRGTFHTSVSRVHKNFSLLEVLATLDTTHQLFC